MLMRRNLSTGEVFASALLTAAGAGLAIAAITRQTRRIDLKGRVVMITGGGRGLGLAIARAFAARGAKLAICGRDCGVIAQAEHELTRAGTQVLGMCCDASEPEQMKLFVERVVARFGKIDVLVNNAGQCFVGPAVELEAQDVEKAIRNIFWVQYHPTMAVLPYMRRQGFGRIVNVTSIGGKVPTPHQAAYNAGKHAATGWSETLAVELAKENIRVSTITPPPLNDGAPLHVHFNGRAEEEFEWFTRTLTSPARATDTDRTARVVVDAAIHGDADRAVSAMSWLMQRFHGAAPGLSTAFLRLVDRGLPAAADAGRTSRMKMGMDVASRSGKREVRELAEAAKADQKRYRPV